MKILPPAVTAYQETLETCRCKTNIEFQKLMTKLRKVLAEHCDDNQVKWHGSNNVAEKGASSRGVG